MTDDQKRMIAALDRCTFQPGSHPKRFVRDVKYQTADLSPRQDWYLRRLYYSYRRQIGHDQPKPADFDNPPPPPPKSKQVKDLEDQEARGEVLICRGAPELSSQAAATLERLRAWNEGKARTI